MTYLSTSTAHSLRAGETVQVRSKEEILRTLDKDGRLDGMPFMPEMLALCGTTLKVDKRAHKTCDPVNGLESRRMPRAVHLSDVRCSGSAHSGCQAGCLIFWKEAWLRRPGSSDVSEVHTDAGKAVIDGCTEEDLLRGTLLQGQEPGSPEVFVCQATQVAAATVPLKWWDARQYLEDYTSGNATLLQMGSALVFWAYHNLTWLGLGFGAAMRWAYDQFQRVVGGAPYPWRQGRVPRGTRTPSASINAAEGDLVTIRSYQEILDTLDEDWKNRGLYFDAEMVPYTGGTYRVLKRVKRIIDEKTGRMLEFKNEALILDKVVCQARYAKCRKLCPRGYYLYWREIWLERFAGRHAPETVSEGCSRTAR